MSLVFKYKIIVAYFIFLITNQVALCQENSVSNPFKVGRESFKFNGLNYIRPIESLIKSKDFFISQNQSDSYYQALATYYSFVGEYKNAIESFNFNSEGSEDSINDDTNSIKVVDASRLILEMAPKYQVIMINEAHHVPMHRAFFSSLLDSLYNIGYKILAVEALNYKDKSLTDRGYPSSNSGFYMAEPVFANMIRKALSLGFKIVPYEVEQDQEKIFNDWQIRSNYRDSIQAENILKVLNEEPNAKILIYAGYDHIYENVNNGLKRMAYKLREMTGLNPLTIDQTFYSEKGSTRMETEFYKEMSERIKTPSIAIKDAVFFRDAAFLDLVDIQIIHPRSVYINNKASWLYEYQNFKAVEIRCIFPTDGQFIAQAYFKSEFKETEDPIPIDQTLVNSTTKDKVFLALPKESIDDILVIIRNVKNEILKEFTLENHR